MIPQNMGAKSIKYMHMKFAPTTESLEFLYLER
jgi:hypothetical protein